MQFVYFTIAAIILEISENNDDDTFVADHVSDPEPIPFMQRLRDIMDRVDYDGSYDERRLGQELEAWFSVHFSTHDARPHSRFGH